MPSAPQQIRPAVLSKAERTDALTAGRDRLRKAAVAEGLWGAYRDGSVTEAQTRRVLKRLAADARNAAADRTQPLVEGSINRTAWRKGLREELTPHYYAGAMAALGQDRLGDAALTDTQRRIARQFGRLTAFGADLGTGTTPLDGRAVQRAALYGGATWALGQEVARAEDLRQGFDEERATLTARQDCDDCIERADQGWQPVGVLKPLGQSRCGSNCRCYWERRQGQRFSAYGPSQATVKHTDYPKRVALQSARSLFGPKATLADFASAVGAPDDATVEVVPDFETALVYIRGPGYTATRTIKKQIVSGKLVIDNESFYVEQAAQGRGLGAQVFGRQVEQASRLGVAKLRTEAAGNVQSDLVGYKVWPRFGYDGPLPADVKEKIAAGTIAPPYPVERISELMRTPEGRTWWDANGQTAQVTFDLTEGSTSRATWDVYRQEKTRTGR